MVVACDTVLIVRREVVSVDETRICSTGSDNDFAGLKAGVVIDGDVGGAVEKLEQTSVASPIRLVHVIEQIVGDQNPLRLLAGIEIVGAKDIHARSNMANDVVGERHVLHHRPGRGSVLVAHRKQNRITVLGAGPVVLEDISID